MKVKKEEVLEFIRTTLREQIDGQPEIEESTIFQAIDGFDSLDAVVLITALEDEYGVALDDGWLEGLNLTGIHSTVSMGWLADEITQQINSGIHAQPA